MTINKDGYHGAALMVNRFQLTRKSAKNAILHKKKKKTLKDLNKSRRLQVAHTQIFSRTFNSTFTLVLLLSDDSTLILKVNAAKFVYFLLVCTHLLEINVSICLYMRKFVQKHFQRIAYSSQFPSRVLNLERFQIPPTVWRPEGNSLEMLCLLVTLQIIQTPAFFYR